MDDQAHDEQPRRAAVEALARAQRAVMGRLLAVVDALERVGAARRRRRSAAVALRQLGGTWRWT